MRKQGAILLGNGGDNSVGSQGTFYEGAMTAAARFRPTRPISSIQANVVAAKYDVARGEPSSAAAAAATAMPPRTADVLARLVAGHHRDVHEHDGRGR